jgi:hypothetical protein
MQGVGDTLTCVTHGNSTNEIRNVVDNQTYMKRNGESGATGNYTFFGRLNVSLTDANCLLVSSATGSNMFRVDCTNSLMYVKKVIPATTNLYDIGDSTHVFGTLVTQIVNISSDARIGGNPVITTSNGTFVTANQYYGVNGSTLFGGDVSGTHSAIQVKTTQGLSIQNISTWSTIITSSNTTWIGNSITNTSIVRNNVNNNLNANNLTNISVFSFSSQNGTIAKMCINNTGAIIFAPNGGTCG